MTTEVSYVMFLESLFDGRKWYEVHGDPMTADQCREFVKEHAVSERKEALAIKCRGTTSYAARRKARALALADRLDQWGGSFEHKSGRTIIYV
mgnify:CR=1 FL=1